MTTFTIHTDDVLAAAIRNGAAEAGLSINMFIKDVLGATLGVFKRKKRPLPDFFNITPLSKEAADEIRSVQKDFEVIDEEMWK
jgi:hypothetical protein